MSTLDSTEPPRRSTRSCTKVTDDEYANLTNHELSKLISSRPYKSRSQRPCDFCRKRKTCCILEGGIPCTNCKKLNNGNCSFDEGPIKRVYKKKRRSKAGRKPKPRNKLFTEFNTEYKPPKVKLKSQTTIPKPKFGTPKPRLASVDSASSITSSVNSLSEPVDLTPNSAVYDSEHDKPSYILKSSLSECASSDESCALFDESFMGDQYPRAYDKYPDMFDNPSNDTMFEFGEITDKKLGPVGEPYFQISSYEDDYDDNIMNVFGDI